MASQSLSAKADELRATIQKLSDRIGRVENHLAFVTALVNDASNRSKDNIDALCRLAKLIECHLALSNEFKIQCASAYALFDATKNRNEDPVQTDTLLAQFRTRIDILAKFIDFSDVILSHTDRFTEWAVSLSGEHPWLRPCATAVGSIAGFFAGALLTKRFCPEGFANAALEVPMVCVGGLVLEAVAALAVSKAFEWSTTTAEGAQVKELRKLMRQFPKDPQKYSTQLERLQKGIRAFYGPLLGAAHVTLDCCPICLREDLTPCTHTGPCDHKRTCMIQVYKCRHAICDDCAWPQMSLATCPLCRKPRRRLRNAAAA